LTVSDLKPLFEPKGIAIIGASRDPEKPGHVILKIMLENRRRGLLKAQVYPVNPFAEAIMGVKCYPSVRDIPGNVDLAVIVVPARLVPRVVEDCGVKGVKVAVVISAGFSEVGETELERELVETAKRHSVRIVGPNCIGVLCPWTGVDTIFLPVEKTLRDGRRVVSTPRPKPGYVTLLSQSGAFGTAAIDYMSGEGIGLNAFVSYGNKADIDETDLLEYFAEDPRTRVILMYVESLDRGRKVVEAARRVTLRKPVVALKAGRTKAGARAAASHTAALAGTDEIYQAAFRRAGIIRAYDVEELFDMAKALAMQPPARGGRVAIVTDGGGAGVMATDECEMLGMSVPELRGETRAKLEQLKQEGVIPPFASVTNPVDLTGSVTPEMYLKTVEILLESNEVDMIIVLALHQVPGIEDPVELARQLADLVRAKGYVKPVLAVDTGWSEAALLTRETFDEMLIPSYPIPERAARAARALFEYGRVLEGRGALESYLKNWRPAL